MTERDRTHGQTGDELDTMPGPGLRSDQAGASGSLAGPAPKGGDPEAPHPTETRSDPDVPAGDATGRRRPGNGLAPRGPWRTDGPLGRQFLKRALADKI